MIDLEGVVSNPNGIGAKVDVWNAGQRISRNVLPDGGFHDFSDLRLHFGLDGAYSVDSINVYWPSGIVQKLGNINTGQLVTIIEDTTVTAIGKQFVGIDQVKISPNPVHDKARIEFETKQHGHVLIEICNLQGEIVTTILDGSLNKGFHHLNFNLSHLKKGVYFLTIKTGSYSSVKKVVVR